jgi:methyltransferase-like protein
MKIKEGFVRRNVGGSDVVVAVCKASVEFNAMINLNSTGAFIWSLLENQADEEEIVAAMVEKYGIDKELASRDAKAFLDKARNAGVIEE